MIQIAQQICRGYLTRVDRKRAIAQLKRRGYNHFVPYMDSTAEFKYALCYGRCLDEHSPQQSLKGVQ